MDLWLQTILTKDNIDGFYFRTHPISMTEENHWLRGIWESLGFLAHLNLTPGRGFDPYCLALGAKEAGLDLGLTYFCELAQRMQELEVLDRDLCLIGDYQPIVQRLTKEFRAMEGRMGLQSIWDTVGDGGVIDEADPLYPAVLGAVLGDAELQYGLAERYLDPDAPATTLISYNETDGFYWMLRSARGRSPQAAARLAGMYATGEVVKQSQDKARRWMRRALEYAKANS